MTFDPAKLRTLELPPVQQSYSARDSIIYAAGIGASIDPVGDGELRYLYERHGPLTIPTMATVIGQRAMWMDDPALGIDWRSIVHGEQRLTMHEPLPAAAAIVSDERVTDIFDKGADKGAIVWLERTIRSADRATLFATLHTAYFLRGDGGCGGPAGPAAGPAIPDRTPDATIDLPTRSDQAILYRLSGDVNPLHVDPGFARKVGFPAPILHGLCSYGIAARALIATLCGDDPARLAFIGARFSAPAFPGDTIRTDIWRREDGGFAFRCRAVERDAIILNNGAAKVRAQEA